MKEPWATVLDLSDEERFQLRQALRYPRGRYNHERASQLSGVPRRTIHYWAQERLLVPDFNRPYGKQWSYRDLVFLRLFAWLRSKAMSPREISDRIATVRKRLSSEEDLPLVMRSDGASLAFVDEHADPLTGQSWLVEVFALLPEFELTAPLDTFGDVNLWGPDLIWPSSRTAISPWIMGGEPCVRQTRIPTSSLFALRRERNLTVTEIVRLYPDVGAEDVRDSVQLEERLRRLSLAA